MKRGKKTQKRLENRIKGYESILADSKNTKYPGAFRRPGSRNGKSR